MVTFLLYFAALETLFPLLLIMDLLLRLSFWQTVKMRTTTAEKEEAIIEVNQEGDENRRKETKTKITTETRLHIQTINVSIPIYILQVYAGYAVYFLYYLYCKHNYKSLHELPHT